MGAPPQGGIVLPKKKSKSGTISKKETHHNKGNKTLFVSDGHVIAHWIPPTSYCGRYMSGYGAFTPGYGNDRWPGPITCETCMSEIKASQ